MTFAPSIKINSALVARSVLKVILAGKIVIEVDDGFSPPVLQYMRKLINGLSILVEGQLELDPLSGHLFAFCNRKRDIIKILYWDRNGFCLFHKRLEKDRFLWPEKVEGVVNIHGHELS